MKWLSPFDSSSKGVGSIFVGLDVSENANNMRLNHLEFEIKSNIFDNRTTNEFFFCWNALYIRFLTKISMNKCFKRINCISYNSINIDVCIKLMPLTFIYQKLQIVQIIHSHSGKQLRNSPNKTKQNIASTKHNKNSSYREFQCFCICLTTQFGFATFFSCSVVRAHNVFSLFYHIQYYAMKYPV